MSLRSSFREKLRRLKKPRDEGSSSEFPSQLGGAGEVTPHATSESGITQQDHLTSKVRSSALRHQRPGDLLQFPEIDQDCPWSPHQPWHLPWLLSTHGFNQI